MAGVLVVDSASTDGTRDYLRERLPGGLTVDYVRLRRNGGGAEGFHYGVRAARERQADWIWLMDDDCEPRPDTLERLLASPRAADATTVALAPLVVTAAGEPMPLNRGWVRGRWFRMPVIGLSPEHLTGEHEIGFSSFVGPLVRTAAARATDPPRREFFIWYDDLEYFLRLRTHGRAWLVADAGIVHHDVRTLASLTLRALLREFARGYAFEDRWKRMYGMRNMLFCGRRYGFLDAPRAASVVLAWLARGLMFESHRLRTARLVLRYARDGWRGRFLNLPPERWAKLARVSRPLAVLEADALAYDGEEPAAPPERLASVPSAQAL